MARHEGPREDLLKEAVALVERMEIKLSDGQPVVVGFRRDGCASFFFDQDPVYQFNTLGELRRAYCDGLRYKADGRSLAALAPDRSEHVTELVRQQLGSAAAGELLGEAERRLEDLERALATGTYTLVGEVVPEGRTSPAAQLAMGSPSPAPSPTVERTLAWLRVRLRPIVLAQAPNAR